jgi:hypothetical protein
VLERDALVAGVANPLLAKLPVSHSDRWVRGRAVGGRPQMRRGEEVAYTRCTALCSKEMDLSFQPKRTGRSACWVQRGGFGFILLGLSSLLLVRSHRARLSARCVPSTAAVLLYEDEFTKPLEIVSSLFLPSKRNDDARGLERPAPVSCVEVYCEPRTTPYWRAICRTRANRNPASPKAIAIRLSTA